MKRKRTYKILSFEERKAIEMMYRSNMSAQEIASKLEISAATVYRELERGNTHIMDRNGRSGYSAVIAQNNAERLRKNRGRRRHPSADDEKAENAHRTYQNEKIAEKERTMCKGSKEYDKYYRRIK